MDLYAGGQLYPHPGQWAAYESKARFTVMSAGTQGGKTSFLPWILAREVLKQGQGDYLAVTSSYDLFKLKFLPAMREVFEDILGIARYHASIRALEIRDPKRGFWAKNADDKMYARILLRSAQSPSGLESSTAKCAVLDEAGQEAFTLTVWEAILRRLSLAQGRVWIGTTLYTVAGWLRDLHDRWQAGDPSINWISFPSIQNPVFPRDEWDRAERTMQGWRFNLFYRGQYGKIPSQIYGDYEPNTHDVEPFEIPVTWPVVVGVDPSGAHCATVWLAEDPDTRTWYAFNESLELGNTTRENVERAQADGARFRETTYVGGGPSETQERRDWTDAGLFLLEPPITGVEPGIDRGVGLFKSNKIKVFKNLVQFKKDLGNYRRKVDESGEVTDQIINPNSFHLADAYRAAASLIAGGPQVGTMPNFLADWRG